MSPDDDTVILEVAVILSKTATKSTTTTHCELRAKEQSELLAERGHGMAYVA